MQIGLSAWIEGIPERTHDCRFDIFWIEKGLVPPCKRKPAGPGYGPMP